MTEGSQYQVIEGNTQNKAVGPNAKSALSQGDACSGNCFNLIFRFNVMSRINSGGMVDDNAENTSVNPGFYNVKSYNNTWVDLNSSNYSYTITENFSNHSINPAALNELSYYPASVTSLNPYASDSSTDSTFNYGHCS